ncbi:hypothetical protein P280DRAFT_428028 [Massarina eburnea CBS 473.64]|uniref:Cytochrome b561 domain-containing protein n=1 Tax=Massarina eburnea CBS 473.64 TaxID=1395130 RepID=A0A6A6S0L3_9PLEO|nr:hypothetical protein P280DRAFT_428028 [Massarina eburnea CBS 473.64]
MASATGIPENINGIRGSDEQEPLLGQRGDATQMEGQRIWYNLWLGTAPIAQAGIWILAAIVWGAILNQNLIFFSAHPLLNSAGLVLVTQSALILQPTHTPSQKRAGTTIHFLSNLLGVSSLIAGLVIIEINKSGPGDHPHFESPHAILGLLFYLLIVVQALVGFTQYYTPSLYGGVEKAKSIWKYHRSSGYLVLTLGLATVCASSWTTYSLKLAHIEHWAVIVSAVLVLVGVLPRIKLGKLGVKKDSYRERLGS